MNPEFHSTPGRPTLTVAYFSNVFPASVESYVMEEIAELRRRGAAVIPCSARRPRQFERELKPWAAGTVYIQPVRFWLVVQTLCLCLRELSIIAEIITAAIFREQESLSRRVKALLHTFLGAYLAALLQRTAVDHIHVHHGYFGCWIAMVAARLRRVPFSMTLHGSDLLLHRAYLNTKLANCQFCITVSEFNRRYILEHYGVVKPQKLFVRRIGVSPGPAPLRHPPQTPVVMLAVGRLHSVKNHAFLIETCTELKRRRLPFACLIAGEGDERRALEFLVKERRLEHKVVLLGHLSHSQLSAYYENSNLVVLTSRSEGLPLALIEAMAHGKIVLAPAITAIPELVVDGKTGFLFLSNSIDSFVDAIERICNAPTELLDRIRCDARRFITEQYDRQKTLDAFTTLLIEQISSSPEIDRHENFVLQQI